MVDGLLIASSHAPVHGPQLHGPLFVFLVAIALVGGVVLLLRRAKARRGSMSGPENSVRGSDRDRVRSSERDAESGSGADSVSDRDPGARAGSGGKSA